MYRMLLDELVEMPRIRGAIELEELSFDVV
jgi:hypothetical protein